MFKEDALIFPFAESVIWTIENDPSHATHAPYAIDLLVPEGTEIFVPRGGIIIDLKQNSNRGGNDAKFENEANYVTIRHADNSSTFICHLEKDSLLYKIGDKVRVGKKLARQGSTGYTTEPHIHIACYAAGQNIPIRWKHRHSLTNR